MDTGLTIVFIVPRIADIGDNTENIGFKLFIDCHGLLITVCKKDLWPGAHGKQSMFLVEAVFDYRLGFSDQLLIKSWQQGGEIEGGIFNEEDNTYIRAISIVEDVELVFDGFDNSHQDIRLSCPEKNAIYK